MTHPLRMDPPFQHLETKLIFLMWLIAFDQKWIRTSISFKREKGDELRKSLELGLMQWIYSLHEKFHLRFTSVDWQDNYKDYSNEFIQ